MVTGKLKATQIYGSATIADTKSQKRESMDRKLSSSTNNNQQSFRKHGEGFSKNGQNSKNAKKESGALDLGVCGQN
ncbi:hypothetical protein QVD17_42243 [Tagetes erecta]|uniref:Uncharacterized protein n=1 Tax=Tagetes erecta TaxID=13708 RepID=A0AAD8JNW9_TARER|nr:hypothetical protein QVD17_42243 [Tagetes erecta]